MPPWAHFTLLCAAVRACQASSLSCENPNAIPQHGTALLQLDRTSKSLNVVASEVAELTATEPFTAAGYEATKKKCCLKAMAEFISDLAISMGYKICNPGFGGGLAVWHTCKGNGATSTFENMKNEIIQYTKDPCSSITSAEICPKRPEVCPDFQNRPLPSCETCSKTEAVPLDFTSCTVGNNNLAGVGPGSGKQEISFLGIGTTGSPAVPFNMIVTAVGGNYGTSNPTYNGVRKMDTYTAGGIGLSGGRSVDLKFEFQLPDGTPVKLPEFHFTLWDIDGNDSREYITMAGYTDYVIDNITDVKVTNEDTNAKVATFSNAKAQNNQGEVSMSGAVLVLSAEARKAAVMMIYKDVSEFRMTFRKTGGSGYFSAVVFNGACSLEDHCRA